MDTSSKTRIAKYLARLGVASRREIEAKIFRGEISVNGILVTTPAVFVDAQDKIQISGHLINPHMPLTRLFLYHKPTGIIVTHKDPESRPTVFESVDLPIPRVLSVGRLDLNSQGLLLLTNDGALARKLEHPTTALKRTYRVRVWGHVCHDALSRLKEGLTVEGITYGPIEARLESQKGENAWVTLSLWEGKNREIRKIMTHLGLEVNVLIRTSYGPFNLENLPKGAFQEVTKDTFHPFLET